DTIYIPNLFLNFFFQWLRVVVTPVLSFSTDAAVNSGDVWFVNFYFPRCSHCHDLAPTVRNRFLFLLEMDGVIRISAVNCGDNGMLCRSKGINSYPSLYVF
uniref:Thioredoxin domain-containing protein n=1 Tax=Cyprinus carpio TaxID=7962 RepID=A0A8C1VTR1_CYPCA